MYQYSLFIVDDKKLQSVLKKLQLNVIGGIEEVNIFTSNNEVIHIKNPKSEFYQLYSMLFYFIYLVFLVEASIPSNTFAISSKNIEVKQVTDMIPDILNQIGPEGLDRLRKYAESIGGGNLPTQAPADDDDDEVPDLVENFEEAANK